MIDVTMPPVQPPNPYQPPAPQQQPHDPSRYEFIVNPQAPQKPGLFTFGAGGPKTRLLAMAGGAVVLVIILVVLVSSLLGGGKGDVTALTGLAEQQAEIARVAQLGTEDAVSQDTQNFAANVELSVTSSQQNLVGYLAKNGVKVAPRELLLKKDVKTDAALAAAKDSGTYDSTFTSLMQTQLTSYQNALKAAYSAASGKTEKQVLSNAYGSAGLLLQQSKQQT